MDGSPELRDEGGGGAVRRQLARILESSAFDASERNRRFLAYIVEETLAGRSDRIKAYSIAIAAFDRDDSFDPQSDPIVRIEASRLRRSLERYYLIAGQDDPVRIDIPKGSYVPTFAATTPSSLVVEASRVEEAVGELPSASPRIVLPRASKQVRLSGVALAGLALFWLAGAWFGGFWPFAKAPVEAPAARQGPVIYVAPFEEEGSSAVLPSIAAGFTREVIVSLTRFNDLFVFGPDTTLRYGREGDLRQIIAELGADFLLTGGTKVSEDGFSVAALLVDARTGRYLWADSFESRLGPEDILKLRDALAERVARSLAQPYGVIFANRAAESEGKPPGSITSYDCVLRFYRYWRSYDRTLYPTVKSCLEEAIVADPDYAEAHATLSLLYSDGYRFGFDNGSIAGDRRGQAVALARHAIELAPSATRGYHALSLAYWLNNDVEGSLEAARTGLALNPNDTEIMADLGMRYAWRNRWSEALPLLQAAFGRNPGQPSAYRLAFFLNHYLIGDYEQALSEARKIDAPHLLYSHAAVALAAAKLDLEQEAEAAIDRILAIDPRFGEHAVADLEMRNIHPDLIPVIIDGLRQAGLPMPEETGLKAR